MDAWKLDKLLHSVSFSLGGNMHRKDEAVKSTMGNVQAGAEAERNTWIINRFGK